jgi:hypothetical protein
MWESGERKQVLKGRRGEKVQNVLRGEREDRAHGCGEMRERERKEREEILNEDRREIKYMEQEGQNRKRKGWGIQRKMCLFFLLLFLCLEKHNNQELL